MLLDQKGVDPKKITIACCRTGERSIHVWLVLKYLPGLDNARSREGSWTEYGNVVRTPIEKQQVKNQARQTALRP